MTKEQKSWLNFFACACVAGFCLAVGIYDIVNAKAVWGPTLIGLGVVNFLLAVCWLVDSAVAKLEERT